MAIKCETIQIWAENRPNAAVTSFVYCLKSAPVTETAAQCLAPTTSQAVSSVQTTVVTSGFHSNSQGRGPPPQHRPTQRTNDHQTRHDATPKRRQSPIKWMAAKPGGCARKKPGVPARLGRFTDPSQNNTANGAYLQPTLVAIRPARTER